jgi:hypothetical protein
LLFINRFGTSFAPLSRNLRFDPNICRLVERRRIASSAENFLQEPIAKVPMLSAAYFICDEAALNREAKSGRD